MLSKLKVSNFALIDNVELEFNSNFSVITGETGAGKSILLKALHLLLGERADYSVLKNNEEKCIIEAEFFIKNLNLQSFFKENDLDYDDTTIIRREFLNSGKSRIFINDSPCLLNVLNELGEKLVNIHSQNQSLNLFESTFQFEVLDNFSQIKKEVLSYHQQYKKYKTLQNQINSLKIQDAENRKEKDYHSFLLQELEVAQLAQLDYPQLEEENDKIENHSKIKESLEKALFYFQGNEQSPTQQIHSVLEALQNVKNISTFQPIVERIQSLKIELKDIENELEGLNEDGETDTERIAFVKDKIQLVNQLLYKHNAQNIDELIAIQQKLSSQLEQYDSLEMEIQKIEKEIQILENDLTGLAKKISTERKKFIPQLEKEVENILQNLSMQHAQLKIELMQVSTLQNSGLDEINFTFKTNLGGEFLPIKKVVSGGELSRLMLAVLTILSKNSNLPTLIFDEIDTGVSGEVASQMAEEFLKIGENSQLIVISHLPQVAARALNHYHVFKNDLTDKTITKVIQLKQEDRIVEVAKMISGNKITDTAIANAKELFKA